MNRRAVNRVIGATLAGLLAGPVRRAAAAGLPPLINLVVPFAPGGGADQLARDFLEAAHITDSTVVVDNKPGANGITATRQVVRQRPDGSTLLLGSSSTQALGPLILNPQADPAAGLAPVTLLAEVANALAVPATSPWHSLDDLVRAARDGSVTYATFGTGSSGHLYGTVLASAAGIELTHVPYRGSGQAMTDLLGGHVQAAFLTTSALDAGVRGGSLRLLGVTGAARAGLFPDVPTFGEQGIRNLDFNGWFGLFAPAGIAPPVVARFAGISQALGRDAGFVARMRQQGYDWVGSDAPHLAAALQQSVGIYRRILAEHPITP